MRSVFAVLPTSRRVPDSGYSSLVAGGAGLAGFRRSGGAGGMVARMFPNPRRTRAGISRPGRAGRSRIGALEPARSSD